MITDAQLDTIRRSGHQRGLMSIALAALPLAGTGWGTQLLPAGPAAGSGAAGGLVWGAIGERTT
jgi:hypothetical protein